ncbi:FG-GAP-like repeat-containing protein [Streptomyces sp. 796.1]|uniref:FG-GAP-like repeat-containing protein n=1 Tax=Streptomyces sp. 796.1 TaxID=3163029 RepID=UPI0039C99BA4
MHQRTPALAPALIALVAATVLTPSGAPAAHAATSRPAQPYDLDGDGYREVVIGVPNGTVAGQQGAGYLAVVPGSAAGVEPAGRWTVSQNSSGVPGAAEPYDGFGTQHTSADLNRDGYADLVIGTPGEDGPYEGGGRITIVWGAATGTGGATDLPGDLAYGGVGGRGVAVADVDGDGALDVVAANDGEEVDSLALARGPFAPGRTPAPLTRLTDTGIMHFSSVVGLAVGDFDGDGRADVAAPWLGLEGDGTALLRGTPTGLTRAAGWHRESGGHAAAAGDFDGDGYADLALGGAVSVGPDDPDWEPQYPIATGVGGTVRVLYGGPRGLAGDRPPVDLSQETPGVPGSGAAESERDDAFGQALSAADADADGYADLAVGAPGEAIGATPAVGSLTLLYGTPSGLGAARSRGWNQGTPGVPGSNEAEDGFGARVVLRDVNGDGAAELHAAAPGEDTGDGRVWSLTAVSGEGPVTGVGYSAASLQLPLPRTDLGFGRGLG